MFVLLSLLTVGLFSASDVSAASTDNQSSYQTAFLYFLPDYQPKDQDETEVRGCAKLGYTVTRKDCAAPRILKDKCPVGNAYKECYCAGDPSCDTSWSLSSSNPRPSSIGASMASCVDCLGKTRYDWTCPTSACADYQLDNCPSNGNCSQCCNEKYKLDSCLPGYSVSENSCEEDCNSSSPNWCAVHSTCHGDCCANGTIDSCDTKCGGSGCCAKICSSKKYSSSSRPPSPSYICSPVIVDGCTCYDCVRKPVPPIPDCLPGVECGDAGCARLAPPRPSCERVCARCNPEPTPCSGVTCPTDLTCPRGCKTYSDATSCCESVCTECNQRPMPNPCRPPKICGDAGCASYSTESGCEDVCVECNQEPTPPSDPCANVTCPSALTCSTGCKTTSEKTSCCESVCIECNPDDPCASTTCPTALNCPKGCKTTSEKTSCCSSVCIECNTCVSGGISSCSGQTSSCSSSEKQTGSCTDCDGVTRYSCRPKTCEEQGLKDCNGSCISISDCCPACTGGKECQNGTCVDPCASVTCPKDVNMKYCTNYSTATKCCASVCTEGHECNSSSDCPSYNPVCSDGFCGCREGYYLSGGGYCCPNGTEASDHNSGCYY